MSQNTQMLVQEQEKRQNIYVGIDMHKSQWTVHIYANRMTFKQGLIVDPDPVVLYATLRNYFPKGILHTVYEAGYFGFAAHRKLTELGVKSIVVDAGSLSISNKERERKSDKVDAKRLAKDLRDDRLRPIFIPSLEQEAFRKLSRTREDLVSLQTSTKNKIKSTLSRLRIDVPSNSEMQHWSGRFLKWLKHEVMFADQAEKISFDVLLRTLDFVRIETLFGLRSQLFCGR